MEKYIFNTMTRQEIVGIIKENTKIVNELMPKSSHLTDFGRFRLDRASGTVKKYTTILNAFPDQDRFTFHNGELVKMEVSTDAIDHNQGKTMEATRKYKKYERGTSSVIKMSVCLDDDLKSVIDAQPNKSRFINNAIRQYIKKAK